MIAVAGLGMAACDTGGGSGGSGAAGGGGEEGGGGGANAPGFLGETLTLSGRVAAWKARRLAC